ncbi:MAG TPA: hypothetical protein VMC61_03695 [Methanocella sp.]|nr:hypothetical protein [Methanocella sp.]
MKYRYPALIAIFLISIATVVSGCCCCTSIPTLPGATTGGGATIPAVATRTTGGTTLGSMIDFNKVHWYEYQMSSDMGGTPSTMKLREDFNVNYQGKNANKITLNMNVGSGDSTMNELITTYTDSSTGATLGGHMQMTAGGQAIMDQDIQPGAAPSTAPGVSTQNPLLAFQGTSVTNSGSESVTVPAGTYVATKYTWTRNGDTGTVWAAPSVPVPVKMSYTSSGSTTSMELTGWG